MIYINTSSTPYILLRPFIACICAVAATCSAPSHLQEGEANGHAPSGDCMFSKVHSLQVVKSSYFSPGENCPNPAVPMFDPGGPMAAIRRGQGKGTCRAPSEGRRSLDEEFWAVSTVLVIDSLKHLKGNSWLIVYLDLFSESLVHSWTKWVSN